MTKLILDTNVWYEISEGRRDANSLRACGNRLIAIPTGILEIASPQPEEKRDTWPKRRGAATAILQYADDIANDTESHLATLWGVQPHYKGPLWHDICEIVSESESRTMAESGVVNQLKRARTSLKVSVIQDWRQAHWKEFASEVEDAIEQHVPGYKMARAEGKYTKLPRNRRAQFRSALYSEEVRRVFVESTFLRALPDDANARVPTREEYARAEPLVTPYVDAYVEYVYGCATSFAPQPNDFGDCECFYYLQGDSMLVTREKRWSAIAKKVCPSRYFNG